MDFYFAGFPECVQVLLENGADPNFTDLNSNSTLIIACDTGSERYYVIEKLYFDLPSDPRE